MVIGTIGRLGALVALASGVAASPAAAQAAAPAKYPLHTGEWLVAGSATLSRTHDQTVDATTTSAGLQPTGLRFVTPHVAVGGTVLLSYSSFSFGHSASYGLGPQVRYYFNSSSAVLPFVSASAVPQWSSIHTNGFEAAPSRDANDRALVLEGSVGLTDMVSTHVGFTGEAYYDNAQFHREDLGVPATDRTYSYGLRFGLSVFVR